MATFSVKTSRFDPYKNFKFRVKWDGRTVAGLNKMSALKRTTEVRGLSAHQSSMIRGRARSAVIRLWSAVAITAPPDQARWWA